MLISSRCRHQSSNDAPTHMLRTYLAVAIFAAAICAGCGDDNNDGTPTDVDTAQIRLEATSSAGATPSALEFEDPSGTLYTLTSLTLAVEEIELDLPDGVGCGDLGSGYAPSLQCDDDGLLGGEDQIKIDGPFIFEVLSGKSRPNISNIEIPALNYQTVDLEVDTARVEDNNVPVEAEIIDRTVVASAAFEFAGQKRELQLSFSFKAEAKAGADNPQNLALEQGDTLVLMLDVANWLDNIPVTRCLQRGELKPSGGVVVLDDQTIGDCQDAEADFEENFEQSLEVRIE